MSKLLGFFPVSILTNTVCKVVFQNEKKEKNLVKSNSLLILNEGNYSNHKALLRIIYTHNHKQCINEADWEEQNLKF